MSVCVSVCLQAPSALLPASPPVVTSRASRLLPLIYSHCSRQTKDRNSGGAQAAGGQLHRAPSTFPPPPSGFGQKGTEPSRAPGRSSVLPTIGLEQHPAGGCGVGGDWGHPRVALAGCRGRRGAGGSPCPFPQPSPLSPTPGLRRAGPLLLPRSAQCWLLERRGLGARCSGTGTRPLCSCVCRLLVRAPWVAPAVGVRGGGARACPAATTSLPGPDRTGTEGGGRDSILPGVGLAPRSPSSGSPGRRSTPGLWVQCLFICVRASRPTQSDNLLLGPPWGRACLAQQPDPYARILS